MRLALPAMRRSQYDCKIFNQSKSGKSNRTASIYFGMSLVKIVATLTEVRSVGHRLPLEKSDNYSACKLCVVSVCTGAHGVF